MTKDTIDIITDIGIVVGAVASIVLFITAFKLRSIRKRIEREQRENE